MKPRVGSSVWFFECRGALPMAAIVTAVGEDDPMVVQLAVFPDNRDTRTVRSELVVEPARLLSGKRGSDRGWAWPT